MQSCTCCYDVLLASETPNKQWRIYHIHLFSSPESILISCVDFSLCALIWIETSSSNWKAKVRTSLTDFELLQPYLVISVVCVWCTHHIKSKGYSTSLWIQCNRTLYKVLNSEMNTFKFPFEKQKSNKFPFLACLVLLDIDCRAQGLVSYSLLIVTLFISYIRVSVILAWGLLTQYCVSLLHSFISNTLTLL